MKISGRQLDMVLNKLKYTMIGYSNDEKDFEVEIGITQEDPGSGVMVNCLTLKCIKTPTEEDTVQTMTVEIYPASEKQEPRANKIESFKIKSKY